jgi:hypothetical protein
MELPNLELIAIHIMKTAGMSFKRLLKRQYAHKYYRMNIGKLVEDRQAAFQAHREAIPAETRVIHGHFRYLDAVPLYRQNPQVPLVTWVRNPVARVISRYYFLKRKSIEGVEVPREIFDDQSLIDFARSDQSRNEMSWVLERCNLEDLAFIGIMEFFAEDVAYLADMLTWKPFTIPERNSNRDFKGQFPPPGEDELQEIAALNQSDVEIYNFALELRQRRLK